MKKLQYILLAAGLWIAGVTCVMADVPAANIRYVKTAGNGGKYTNDGKSWENAKNNIQDAINSLVAAKALPGEVWVGAGTYSPTESTETTGGSTLYMSFKIPAGVTVRGGFPADGKIDEEYITRADQRPMITNTEVGALHLHQTILTGDLSSQSATFVYDIRRNQFTTTFYGNSYHVVTFATNGFHADGHAKALDTSKGEAALDGVIVEHGNAQFPATSGHPHEAYGGGIYMVKGSHVYNTCVRQCEATRAGGGIYMDGGGMADHVYVSECQSLGLGTTYGYGGGICMEDGTYESTDATKGMYPTVIRRSGITGSVARNGGGLAIYCNNTMYKNRLAVSAVLVSNNVAQNEAGGVYLYQGGAVSQMTVTNNKCIGSGIAVNGMINGRSGGIYVRDFANIANSVIWGNECGNRNVQYAGSRSSNEESKKPLVRCTMLSRADYADWSGVIKYRVSDLNTDNTGDAHANYPAFKNPTTTAGYIENIYYRTLLPIVDDGGDTTHHAYSWKVEYSSALTNAGVQTIDLDTAGVTPALNESQDIMGEVFSSHPTLGAYTSTTPVAWPWDNRYQDQTMHLFVDPDADYTDQSARIGDSWDNAAHNLNDVLNLMQQTLNAFHDGVQPSSTNLEKILVHVKEGKVTNNGAYSIGHVRNITLRIPSNPAGLTEDLPIEILGGYPAHLTGHDVSERNPLKYQTIITGDIIDDYNYNVSHLVTMDGAKNVTIDGFQLRNGNASSTKEENANRNGAAFTIRNSENIHIKNCVVANCQAEIGAAVYAENSIADFENCIFHNNASTQQIGLAANKPSIIYAGGTSTLRFDHCDVLRNVGYGAWNDATAHQQWTNSIFYGNMNQAVDDTNDDDTNGNQHYTMALPAFGGTTVEANITGNHCLFDRKSAAFTQLGEGSRYDLSYIFRGGANDDYPRFINPTKNAGVSPSGDITYYGRATSFEPHNTNPMVNAASTKGIAHTSATTSDCWGKDLSTIVNRDFGGLPDIGAVENHEGQKAVDGENAYTDGQGYYGRRLYVRDYRDADGNIDYTVGGDGSSWKNAINGNAYYHEASGKFLGSSRTGTATWKGIKITYDTTYATVKSQFAPSSISQPKFYIIESQTATGKYISVNAKGVFSLVSTKEEATLFLFTGTTSAGTMYEYTSGKFVTFSSGKMTLNAKPYTLNFDVRNGVIRNGSNYMRVADADATAPSVGAASNNKWNFYEATISEKSRKEVEHTDVAVKGINGLQYAVNKSSIWFEQDAVRREVWVGAGVYSKDNETPADADAYNHFPIDHKTTYEPGNPGSTIGGAVEDNTDESCFVIRDGVDVYGAFPKIGNPGKDQRQALVSQYVKVLGGYEPALYETILEPKTPLSTTSMNNTRRVLGQPHLYHSKKGTAHFESGAAWDGFTLRNGYLDSRRVTNARSWGGAGATVYKNVTLRNCVVTRCVNYAPNGSAANGEFRGGGVLVSGGSVEQCYIINNEMRGTTSTSALARAKNGIAYGAGIYLYSGTVYNCVIANNLCHANIADGGGVFIDDIVNFFNNTIVNNKAVYNTRGVGGLCLWSDQTSQVAVYNTISYNNIGYKAKTTGTTSGGNKDIAFQDGGNADIYNCITPDKTDANGTTKGYLHYHDCQVVDDSYFQNNLFEVNPENHKDFTETFEDGAPNTINLRLKAGSKGINMGIVNPVINGVLYDLEEYTDMDYTERVKDCAIDVGAYEYNDAYAITPDTETESGKAIYYVTPKGRGVASATNPDNAACAAKLQKVLDAAGRYKYQNPEMQVVVKVATEESSKASATPFTYYATRSTNPEDQDVRIWSIMVPRGVEVWGGYTDTYTSANDNGFYEKVDAVVTDRRDVVANPTYFDATYTNKIEKTTATTYHIVTFTDRLYDGIGLPYLATDDDILNHNSSYNADLSYNNEEVFKHMTDADGYNERDRAVLDGIFLTGGRADAASSASDQQHTAQNIHQFGGAAVVEPYAHVRNCIVEDNTATYGGALALKEKALVSGSLIRNNTATKGAGIYVFENGTQLNESANLNTYTVHTEQGEASTMDANMPHIFLSTIVRNNAQQGGGLWFTNEEANVRVNSSVLWRNKADDQENVSGAYSPEKPTSDQTSTIEFYPFAYSAVTNLRMSGTNNISLQPANSNGARFAKTENGTEEENKMATDETNFTDFGYYGLIDLSALVRTGMSVSEFDSLRSVYGLAAADFMAVERKGNAANAPARTYVEIGARALLKPFHNKQLMLRLYVAQPEDIDANAALHMKMLASVAEPDSPEEYYSQEGSSFAYPFQSLQNALDYIYLVRSTKLCNATETYLEHYHANNLPFEIILAKGTYYPTRDLSGNYGESLANTFAIPEGVSLYGGFSPNPVDGKWYGRYITAPAPAARMAVQEYDPSVYNSNKNYDITHFGDTVKVNSVQVTADEQTFTISQIPAEQMLGTRQHEDVNKNSIIEPWEFTNQTILSGNATSAIDRGVYHIITACPDETLVGILPDPMYELTEDELNKYPEGYGPKEVGQYIHFNGITFQGGRALNYSSELDEMAKYDYYQGGAVLADGNRYNNSYNTNQASRYASVAEYNTDKGTSISEDEWEALKATDYKNADVNNSIGYRDIPVSFASCRFFDNQAGYGGAIATNVEMELYQSSFENNLATSASDQVPNEDKSQNINVTYAGQGGAVFSTFHLTAYNTLFANNEARDAEHNTIALENHKSYRNHTTGSMKLPGAGGAIFSGEQANLHLFNCDVVRNMANCYPGIFTMNPNYYKSEWNTATGVETIWYNQIENIVLWGNELNAASKSNPANADKLFAAQMVINYGAANRNGAAYDVLANMPANQEVLDDATNDGNLLNKRYSEMLQFSAYEPGRGITPKNDNDFRNAVTDPRHHSFYQFSHINDTVKGSGFFPYQNSNIAISSDNDELEGPAFMRPSTEAGIDGYLEAADWAPARLNNLTDNGNTRLQQSINQSTKEATFVKQAGKFVGSGAYWISRYYTLLPNFTHNLPIGDERYMISQGAAGDMEMYRVSLDPNPTHNQSYIDIGVYEYIHVPLEPETEDEVDILWVSNYEKPENGLPNGHTWLTPTSDLQRAIETLLASRNGHRKEIRLCDGTYAPIYTIDGTLSFYIDSKYLNDAATGGVAAGKENGYGVKSLTIKGGYSREYNGLYNVNLYPAVIKQQTASTPSPKYDHLIFINDATQRYHGSYADVNGYGWKNGDGHTGVHTFPIQIDGVTLINNQSTDDAKGAAIYYRNQTFDSNSLPTEVVSPVHTASSTTEASIMTGIDANGDTLHANIENPHKLIITRTTVLGSGAKNGGKGASAVYVGEAGGNTLIYNSLFHSNLGDPLVASNAKTVNNTFALNGGQVKLSNYNSSESTKDSVSMMFNNVLWRNNDGGSQLTLTDLTASGTDFVHNSTTKAIFAHNAYTGGDTEDIDYTEGDDKPVYKHNYNVGLVDLNTDVTYGPNFHDPENADIMQRDFQISPSMRLLNKGNNTLYGDTALATNNGVYDLAWEVGKRYDLATNRRIAAATIDLGAYEYQYDLNRVLYVDPNKSVSGDGLSWENALGFGNIQNAIDLAGVAHSNLQKSAYVFVKAASSTNLDLHTGETLTLRDGVQVYGSVMADYGVECPYTQPAQGSTERTFRDSILEAYVGDVLLYGRYGVISPVEGHTRIAGINTNGTAFTTTDKTHDMTIIDGFEVMPRDAAAANITAPVMHITPYKSDGLEATGNVQVGLRNIAVHGYNATGCNVAELDNAILYSTLFHHNTVSGDKAVMKVGQYGYLLNATIEGKTIGANDQVQLHGGATGTAWENTAGEEQSHVYCSLVNFNYPGYRHEPTIRTLSGYCYALEDENLNYQLTEYSVNIDNYHSVVPAGLPEQLRGYASAFTPAYTADESTHITSLIAGSYQGGEIGSAKLTVTAGKLRAADRDLLGNFRWQPDFKENPACADCNNNGLTYNIIDRGAFETWKIEKPYFVTFPNYPYPGTCEYIMKGQALMIDPVDIEGDPSAAAHIPGFVLLQEGASLYGNGREIEIAYIGIERKVKNGGDLMVTIPWDQDLIYRGIDTSKDRNAVNGLFIVDYDEANGNALKTINRDRNIPVYRYDPTKRADWQYRMKPSESTCWVPMTEPILPACQGIYTQIVPETTGAVTADSMVVRCMGKGKNMFDFIYEELVEEGHLQHTGKSLTLYRHDDATSTNGGGDFTDSKNAGWNFIGYPYLISLYHPYTKAIITPKDSVLAELNPGVNNQDQAAAGENYETFLASSNPYAMDRPQTMWLYYDGMQTPNGDVIDGTGGFYSVNSWLKEPSAWHVASNVEPVLYVTEAFFIQTNTLQDSEKLTFYRPTYRSHYPSKAPSPAPTHRYYVTDGSENTQPGVISPEQVDRALIPYEKIMRDGHVYIVRRDADGRLTDAYDLLGHRVEL